MIRFLPIAVALATFSGVGLAQTSNFIGATGILDIPCIALYRNGAAVNVNGTALTYKVQMKAITGESFAFSSIAPVTPIDECLGRYDEATNVYTDTVNLGDTAFKVSLTRDANNVFKLNSYQAAGPAKTSLWVVSKGANTVYLAGTIHILHPNDHPLPRAFAEAYEKSSTVYFEIDLDDPLENGSTLTPQQVVAQMIDPERRTLVQVLQSDTYLALVAYLATWNIPVANVQQWAAQRLINLLAQQEVTTRGGYQSAKGVDNFFAARAKADGRLVLGLETSALQNNVLHQINEGAEDKLVREALAAFASGEIFTDLAALVAAWRRGDVATLTANVEHSRAESQRDHDLIQTNRNNAWLPQIEAMLNTSETEIVFVGAAHMMGQDGLITLLKARGYEVRKY